MVGGTARAAPLSRINVAEILRRRVDIEKRTIGIAAAIVTPHGDRITCHGRKNLGSDGKISGATLFEIGSITKVFTALLLTNLALDGVLAIDDPVTKHL